MYQPSVAENLVMCVLFAALAALGIACDRWYKISCAKEAIRQMQQESK